MGWQDIITPKLIFLVAFVYSVGLFLKKTPLFTKEWMIPILLWCIGIISTILVMVVQLDDKLTLDTIITGVVQGTFIAAAAVFGNEIIKQIRIRRLED